ECGVNTGLIHEYDEDSMLLTITNEKQKNDEKFEGHKFKAIRIDLGTRDRSGKPQTSLILRPADLEHDIPEQSEDARAEYALLPATGLPRSTWQLKVKAETGASETSFDRYVQELVRHGMVTQQRDKGPWFPAAKNIGQNDIPHVPPRYPHAEKRVFGLPESR